jgi:tetratricopeptide (TPR) repeat protein
MVYNEPRDWLLNPKHYLGNAYLEKGDFLNAQKTFQLDLLTNNENGWALFGLYKSYFMLNNKAAAAKTWIRYRKAFSKADITLSAAVY